MDGSYSNAPERQQHDLEEVGDQRGRHVGPNVGAHCALFFAFFSFAFFVISTPRGARRIGFFV